MKATSSPSSRSAQGTLVLADDLTGAADAAVALAGVGRNAEVVLRAKLAMQARTEVVSVDLDTRRMAADAAAQAVAHAVTEAAGGAPARRLFKKIDSTLRGHLGVELAAMARALPAPRDGLRLLYLVAPAHPELGRTMANGRLHVHGRPLAGQPALARELEAHGLHCAALAAPMLDRCDAHALRQLVENAAAASAAAPAALVCDARSVDELRRIVAAALDARLHCVWVGSGGLAQALSDMLHDDGAALPSCPSPFSPFQPAGAAADASARRGTIFVVGSFSDVARAQVERLVRGGVTQVAIGMPPLGPDLEAAAQARIEAALSRGDDVALCIDPAAEVQPALAAALARGLAAAVAPSLPRLAALVVCGGDTSRALLEHIGVDRLNVRRSAELGATRAAIALHPHLPLILKAGAFGDEELLLRLRRQPGTFAPST